MKACHFINPSAAMSVYLLQSSGSSIMVLLVYLILIFTTPATLAMKRNECTCICTEENDQNSVSSKTIYGQNCDDHLKFKPEGRDTPDCNHASGPIAMCAADENLVKIRGVKDTCLCNVAVFPGFACKCKGPMYEDVRGRASTVCTCSEGLVTTVKPTTSHSSLMVSRTTPQPGGSTPRSGEGDVGVRPKPTLPNHTRRRTLTPSATVTPGTSAPNVGVIVGSVIGALVILLIVIIAVIIIAKRRRRELIKRKLNIRYESSVGKGSNKHERPVSDDVHQDENYYTPVTPAPDGSPTYTEYNHQTPSVYTVPEKSTGPSVVEYENIGSGKPRPPARVPSADHYNYITPLHYSEPYSDVENKFNNSSGRSGDNPADGGERIEDDEEYMEIKPS